MYNLVQRFSRKTTYHKPKGSTNWKQCNVFENSNSLLWVNKRKLNFVYVSITHHKVPGEARGTGSKDGVWSAHSHYLRVTPVPWTKLGFPKDLSSAWLKEIFCTTWPPFLLWWWDESGKSLKRRNVNLSALKSNLGVTLPLSCHVEPKQWCSIAVTLTCACSLMLSSSSALSSLVTFRACLLCWVYKWRTSPTNG